MFSVFRGAGAEVLTLLVAASAISASVMISAHHDNPANLASAALWGVGVMAAYQVAKDPRTWLGDVARFLIFVPGIIIFALMVVILPFWILAVSMLSASNTQEYLAEAVLCPPLYLGLHALCARSLVD